MLKGKWKKLLLREKVLLISGILLILSIPLSLITLYSMQISMILFVVSVFYNIYKCMEMVTISISETIDTDMQKGEEELIEGKKVSAIVRTIAFTFAIGVGIPMVFILLIYLWISI